VLHQVAPKLVPPMDIVVPMPSNAGRVAPLSPDELSDEQQRALGGWKDLTFARVLLRHPSRYPSFVAHMGGLVRGSSLPPRERQIVILRTLELCGDTYEKAHHLAISHSLGLTERETGAILAGDARELDHHAAVLLRAAEELHRDQCIAEQTWAAMGDRYSTEQQMEVVYLAGCFQTVAMLTKTFGMELEADLERFAALRDEGR
jgi:4-carboxymuconolactone decarboxylase